MKDLQKALCLLFVVVSAGLIFSCTKKAEATSSGNKASVQLITDASGIDDESFNAAAWRGILEYNGDTWENQAGRGTTYEVVVCPSPDSYVPNIQAAVDQGYDLIFTPGFTFIAPLQEVAPKNPNQKFAIVDGDATSPINLPNVMEFFFAEEQGSYLVGVAAALQAQADGIENPKFGFIGAIANATLTRFEMGYIQGIKSIFPNAEVLDFYTNDWAAPNLAKTQAKNWYDSGVYAIFSAAGGSGNGTIAQAKEYRIQGKNVWAIGVDSDQYKQGIYEGAKSVVLTSMLKKVDSSVLQALRAVESGATVSGSIICDLASDSVDFAETNPDLSDDIKAQVRAAKQDIISGNVAVYKTYADTLAAGLAPAGLGAKD
ncbi:MAG: BMP family protein [Treponemataceae bacterium]|nr:MAG: BMP family protein [Treponemataceae bacterium]